MTANIKSNFKLAYPRWLAIDQLIRRQQSDVKGRECSTRKPLSKETLAKALQVNGKTIQRDIANMKDLYGAPIAYKSRKEGFGYSREWEMPSCFLDKKDLMAIVLMKRIMGQYPKAGFVNAINKLIDAMDVNDRKTWNYYDSMLSGRITVKPNPNEPFPDEKTFQQVVDCLSESRELRINYVSPWRDDKPAGEYLTIRPYHLALCGSEWYLMASAVGEHEHNQYKLSRITWADKNKGDRFAPPKDAEWREIVENSFGAFLSNKNMTPIKLRFSKEIAPLIKKRIWHKKQRMIEQSNGDYTLEFPVSTDGKKPFFHVIHWIQSWGKHCKVIKPSALKEALSRKE